MENIAEWLKSIPLLLEFFVPGYLTIFVFRVVRNGSEQLESSESIHMTACVCVSFLLNACCGFISVDWLRVLVEIFIGCGLALLCILLLKNGWIRRNYSKINHTTIADSVFESMGLQLPDQWITVYMKDGSMVYGRSVTFGKYEQDPWISIDCYRTSGPLFENNGKKVDEWNLDEDMSIHHIIGISYSEIIAITNHKQEKSKTHKKQK